jgi:hypothetical protein
MLLKEGNTATSCARGWGLGECKCSGQMDLGSLALVRYL